LVNERELRARLEATQAEVLALRARLAAPIDVARIEGDAAAVLEAAQRDKQRAEAELAQVELSVSTLAPAARDAQENLARLRSSGPRGEFSAQGFAAAAIIVGVLLTNALLDGLAVLPTWLRTRWLSALFVVPLLAVVTWAWRAGRWRATWRLHR
jgi:hypothetical protein